MLIRTPYLPSQNPVKPPHACSFPTSGKANPPRCAMEVPPEDLREHTASRLPSYRFLDIKNTVPVVAVSTREMHGHDELQVQASQSSKEPASTSSYITKPSPVKDTVHNRTHSASTISTPKNRESPKPRPQTLPYPSSPAALESIQTAANPNALTPRAPKARNVPGRNSRNGLEDFGKGPPRTMITQRSYKVENSNSNSSTTDWVAQQQSISTGDEHAPSAASQPQTPRPATDSAPGRPLIKPIRGFKPSSRKSVEMASRRDSMDPDSTLKALDGFDNPPRNPNQTEQDEHNSDDSDLFLRAAREEELAQQASNLNGDGLSRSDSRRSRIGQRASLPPSSNGYQPSISRRRGSDQESVNGSRRVDEQEGVAQALTYRPPGRERPSALDDINRNRYFGANSRSNPTTPRGLGSREISPESQGPYGGRKPSVSDATVPSRTSPYRQSNLSYSTPRTYNSSPLVSRPIDMLDTPETPRAAEGTESTVSTTAPSTVWDELEDLKSRIHRLELTGKLPPTSGAAMSRASNERPPTATTTVTTMSSSPKRGRGNSISPTEPVAADKPAEALPLLHAALAKSKPLLSTEVYKALEATASDALAIASMMGSSGQPGPISSSQSTIGGMPSVSDRQVRRKADSMCRSLTELCLALSEGKTEHSAPVGNQVALRPNSRDNELHINPDPANNQRQLMSTDLTRVKSSPRALSRLEARRSSLLSTSVLPSPRYTAPEAATPTQASVAGRRTSLLLRSRRGGTEEPEEEDDTRFRAPSRAVTEVGRIRKSPREYTSQQLLPEKLVAVQSSLPVRRHYASTSLTNSGVTPMPPVSSLGGRKYLDRSTPERDTTSVVGRLAEDRGHRKSSIGQGFPLGRTGSLTRRRQPNSNDISAGQQNGYQ